MALGPLPYRWEITAHTRVGPADGPTDELTVQVRDANNAARGSAAVLSVGAAQPTTDVLEALEALVQQQLEADGGSRLDLLTAMAAAGNRTKAWVTGDPAFVPDSIPLNGVVATTWTNMPAAGTELAGSRVWIDLSLATEIRFVANVLVAGAAAAVLALQYSADGGTNWAALGAGNEPLVALNTTGPKKSAWTAIAAAAKGDVLLRIGGSGGNGAADPQFGLVMLQVR